MIPYIMQDSVPNLPCYYIIIYCPLSTYFFNFLEFSRFFEFFSNTKLPKSKDMSQKKLDKRKFHAFSQHIQLTKEAIDTYILTPVLVLFLDNSLCIHSIYNFFKSGNIGTYYVVSFKSVSLCCIIHVMADIYHNVLKFRIYFLKGPAQSLAVL